MVPMLVELETPRAASGSAPFEDTGVVGKR